VPGLDDEELADPDELERQVMREEWGPILALPVRTRRGWIQPNIDDDGRVDWGAFGTVDFSRTVPEFDKARYKADKLQERLTDIVIMLSIVSRRLPRVQFRVLKYLRMGIIDIDQIVSEDMRALARLHSEARRLRQEITRLREASWRGRRGQLAEVLE
jgi:hypothetical protein